ncbi:PQQ-dependent dehydrogenase, methanol/ethanol family [Niveispirillum irakense]|uniref:PQQ-dependent dehydrogenase, methanol/ethanol family n=1 Tax=Niveispirillum irakense TaxID=34011 RepID=UPI0004082DE9|nr:PQQ-dependent dehydrogenase, methanol/ethanol family [Niveispirillum irakense]
MSMPFRRPLLAAALLLTVAAMPLQAAPPGADWPGYGGPDENHYSPLAQINEGNINRLKLAWYHDIDVPPSSFTAPIAVDGVLYFAAGHAVIHAMDAATGKLLWRYDPEAWKQAGQKLRGAWGIRGIAYDQGRIFTGTIDGRLIAIDARTGKPEWSVMTVEKEDERYVTGAPWVFNGKVVIGHGGADFAPIRGYVTAYDQKTGKQLWRFHTVPGDPAKGFENKAMEMAAKTWTGEWWKYGGGGTVWNTMAYDPKFNRLYIGTGNGSPWNQKIRSPGGGDNLFLCSIVALDADTGAYVWHYQTNPGETWDYNSSMDIELAELEIDGKRRPVILHAPKNGFFYVIDRETGKLISAEKIVKVNWADRIDIETGRPVENPAARYPDGKPALVFPSPFGAHNVEAMSFNPKTGLVYIPVMERGQVYVDPPGDLSQWRHSGGQRLSTGTGAPPDAMQPPPPTSALLAWNPVTQKEAWRLPLKGARNGATATTAGNLVMQGRAVGRFDILAANNGRTVWSFDAQTAVQAQPITYMAKGKQYITVIAGARYPGAIGLDREWNYHDQQWRVLTFALEGKATLPPRPAPMDMPLIETDRIDPALATAGRTTYAQRCSICHGPAARSGGAAPDLLRSPIVGDGDSFKTVLHDGVLRERGMPDFPELSDGELEGLRHYIHQRAREEAAIDAGTLTRPPASRGSNEGQ